MTVHAALVRQRHGLAQDFDHRRNEEIATEFDEIRNVRLLAHHERALSDRLQERREQLERLRRSGEEHEQPTARRGIRPTEYRRGHEVPARAGV